MASVVDEIVHQTICGVLQWEVAPDGVTYTARHEIGGVIVGLTFDPGKLSGIDARLCPESLDPVWVQKTQFGLEIHGAILLRDVMVYLQVESGRASINPLNWVQYLEGEAQVLCYRHPHSLPPPPPR